MIKPKPKKQPLVYSKNLTLPVTRKDKVDPRLPVEENTEQSGRKWRKILKRTALIIVAAVVIFFIVIGVKLYQNAAKLTGDHNPLHLFGLLHPPQLAESNGRVNILVAGNSADDPNHQGADLTDSIMVLSLNPKNKTAVTLSVPRDLWVNIPGYGHAKINEAFVAGSHYNSDLDSVKAGMQLLAQVVQTNLGIQINYYALVNYGAFRDAVNALGGIQITINSSDPRGIYDSNTNVKLPNGIATLDGQQALDLARSRGDGYGSYGFPAADFNRTLLQREMAIAMKDKAAKGNIISNPFKLVSIADALGTNVKTNFTLPEMARFYYDIKSVKDSSIKSYGLNDVNGVNYLRPYYTYNRENALIPASGVDNFSQIQQMINGLLQ